MKDKNARPRIAKRRKMSVPLYALTTSDAAKIISDFPRRLEELWELFEDSDRTIRQRAAAALAQLVCLQPETLKRSEYRIKELLLDESAYVRWHAVYTVGHLIEDDLVRMKRWMPDLVIPLEDPNGIVRAAAAKVLRRVAVQDSQIVIETFQAMGQEIPPVVAEALKKRKTQTGQQALHHRKEKSV